MGKTLKKIGVKNGQRVAIRSAKHKEGDIEIPYNCRCEYCMGLPKQRSKEKITKQTVKEELEDYFDATGNQYIEEFDPLDFEDPYEIN